MIMTWCMDCSGVPAEGRRVSRVVPVSVLNSADGMDREADQLRYRLEEADIPASVVCIHVMPDGDDAFHPGRYKRLTAVVVS